MKTGYEEQLQNPDKGARGKTRWWWYGCRVNREDIVYQLDQMLEAGIGVRNQGKFGIFLSGVLCYTEVYGRRDT